MALPVDRIHDFPSVQRALEFISGRFPLKSQDISNGAVGKAKLGTDALQAFPQLATPGTVDIAFGTDSVTFSGGTSSSTTTITHNLGRNPLIVIPISTSGATWFNWGVPTTTQATLQGFRATALTGSQTFGWVAIG